MDLSERKTTDLQASMFAILDAVRVWEREWYQAPDARRKMEAFRAWDGSLRRKAEIKAELKRRGAHDYDWTEPKPPRRLPG